MKSFTQIIFNIVNKDIYWKKTKKLLDFFDKSNQKKYYSIAPRDKIT